MSTAKLNVWVTQKGEPCRIDGKRDAPPLFVYVLHCNGEVLEWCGRRYVAMETKCGHLEVEIPVGCYVVGAVENPHGIPPLGNHLTHIQIVRANCGDHVCVTLFNPTFHFCSHWFRTAMEVHLAGELPGEIAGRMKEALQAVARLEEVLPPDEFTVRQARELRIGRG